MTFTAPTNMTPDWITRVVQANPFTALDGGNIRTCPVRLGFPHLEKPQKALEDGKADKYAATALYPMAGINDAPLRDQGRRVAQEKWGDKFLDYAKDPNFHMPWKDQGDKSQYEGFVPGLGYFTANGERKPQIVMQNGAPYTGRIYPGQWAFLIVRPFAFETKNRNGSVLKRGIGLGLQSVMIVCDDTEFGGGSIDTAKAFAGVQIDANVNPSDAFNGDAAGAPVADPFA